MDIFRWDIPPHVGQRIRHLPPDLKRGVKAALRALARDPALGEPLRGELAALWKYRVKRFRIVYVIDRPGRDPGNTRGTICLTREVPWAILAHSFR